MGSRVAYRTGALDFVWLNGRAHPGRRSGVGRSAGVKMAGKVGWATRPAASKKSKAGAAALTASLRISKSGVGRLSCPPWKSKKVGWADLPMVFGKQNIGGQICHGSKNSKRRLGNCARRGFGIRIFVKSPCRMPSHFIKLATSCSTCSAVWAVTFAVKRVRSDTIK